MRAGYVVSGVVFLSLGTVFGLVAMFLGVFYGIALAGTSACVPSASATASQIAQCNAITDGTIITAVGAIAFYLVSTLFLWHGFKAPAPTQLVTVMQPVAAICPNCRFQVQPGQRFCPNCGTKLG